MLETLLRRTATMERLLLLVLRGEGEILMDEAAVLALVQAATKAVNALAVEVRNDTIDNPELQAAFADLQSAVAADGLPTEPTSPEGSAPDAV
jgi:hypothetical protein